MVHFQLDKSKQHKSEESNPRFFMHYAMQGLCVLCFSSLLLSFSVGCSFQSIDTGSPQYSDQRHCYVSIKNELLDDVGMTFYDQNQLFYHEDDTYLVYTDDSSLVYYHVNDRRISHALKFPVLIENCNSISAYALYGAVVHYGSALLVYEDGVVEIHELGGKFDRFEWSEHMGMVYFPDQGKVVLPLKLEKWPGLSEVKSWNKYLGVYDFRNKRKEILSVSMNDIYSNEHNWSFEVFFSKSKNYLIVSEHWSPTVKILDMTDYSLQELVVVHPKERIKYDLPDINHPDVTNSSNPKFTLWEIQHSYYESYGMALADLTSNKIYRFYFHRIPLNDEPQKLTKNQKGVSIIEFDMENGSTNTFSIPADRYYMTRNFWMNPAGEIEHIKYLKKTVEPVEPSYYMLEKIRPICLSQP